MNTTFQYNGGTGTVAMLQTRWNNHWMLPNAGSWTSRDSQPWQRTYRSYRFWCGWYRWNFNTVKAAGSTSSKKNQPFFAFLETGNKILFITGPMEKGWSLTRSFNINSAHTPKKLITKQVSEWLPILLRFFSLCIIPIIVWLVLNSQKSVPCFENDLCWSFCGNIYYFNTAVGKIDNRERKTRIDTVNLYVPARFHIPAPVATTTE